MGIKIKLGRNELVQQALKRFKRMLDKEGVRRDMVRHRYHETKGERRRRQRHRNAKKVRRTAAW